MTFGVYSIPDKNGSHIGLVFGMEGETILSYVATSIGCLNFSSSHN